MRSAKPLGGGLQAGRHFRGGERRRERGLDEHGVLDVEAEVERANIIEAPDEEPRPDQQNDGQRRLHDEQRVAQNRASVGALVRASLEPVDEIGSRRLESRRDPRRDTTEKRDADDEQCRTTLDRRRGPLNVRQQQTSQRRGGPKGERQGDRAANRAE